MNNDVIYVEPEIHFKEKPTYILVGGSPSVEDEITGIHFSSDSGLFLRKALNKFLDFDNQEYYMTTLFKVRIQKDEMITNREVLSWCNSLANELEGIDPNFEAKTIAVGDVSQQALDFIAVPHYCIDHPADILLYKDKYFNWINQIKEINR